jgi:hypothetical protein
VRLGELLIKAGKVTTAEVEETLKSQAIFGGRFGTNLVEMGYLDEHDLAHFLSKLTGIPHASPEQLMAVPPQITRLIPEEAVRKYNVMPVALNNRKLTVAMTDPTNYAAIDELSFLTGYIIVPVITPELRLVSALEKHYNIRRKIRYIRVEGGGRGRGRQEPQQAEPRLPQGELAKHAAPATAAPAPPKSAPTPPPVEEEEILELPLLAEFDSFSDDTSAPLAADTLSGGLSFPEPEQERTLEETLRRLTEAEDRDAIAEIIVDYTAQLFDRAALFLLKGGLATGWVAKVEKKPVTKFDLLELPLSEPSVLKVVSESKTFYLGPLPATHYNGRIVSALGGGHPVNNLLVPLVMMGRVVAILYVSGGPLQMSEQVPEMQRLMLKTSLAFEILILKNKIMVI